MPFNIFKRKEKKTPIEQRPESDRPSGLIPSLASGVLLSPHATEKALALGQGSQYVFRVAKGANKDQIRRSVESLYQVKVKSVAVINVPGKERGARGRTGRGWKGGYKKAIVSLKAGQKIDILG